MIKKDIKKRIDNDESLNYSGCRVIGSKVVFFESYDDIDPEIIDVVNIRKVLKYGEVHGTWLANFVSSIAVTKGNYDGKREAIFMHLQEQSELEDMISLAMDPNSTEEMLMQRAIELEANRVD